MESQQARVAAQQRAIPGMGWGEEPVGRPQPQVGPRLAQQEQWGNQPQGGVPRFAQAQPQGMRQWAPQIAPREQVQGGVPRFAQAQQKGMLQWAGEQGGVAGWAQQGAQEWAGQGGQAEVPPPLTLTLLRPLFPLSLSLSLSPRPTLPYPIC